MANIFQKRITGKALTATVCLTPVINKERSDKCPEYEVSEISENFIKIFKIPVWLLKGKKVRDIQTDRFFNSDYYEIILEVFSVNGPDAVEFYSETNNKRYLITKCRHGDEKIIKTITATENEKYTPSANFNDRKDALPFAHSRAESDPVTFLSHEVRTPLNSILCYSQLMENGGELNKERLEYISHINKCCSHILDVVNNALALAKVRLWQTELEEIPFNLTELIKDAAEIVGPIANTHGNRIDFAPSSDAGKSYFGDASKLKQVVINLLGNASKFTSNGKIVIGCLNVPISSDKDEISISVTDTGIGIERDKINKIFTPFFGSSQKMKNSNSGAGMGLALSNHIVKAMGGSGIKVKSEPGTGSEFQFNIKLKKADGEWHKPDIPEPPTACDLIQKINILIIEDDEACSRLLRKLLEWNKNVTVSIAANESEALKSIEAINFDIILMDLHIQGISGIDLTKKVRNAKNAIPIIAVTGEVSKKTIENCYNAGIDDYISKPFKMNELIKKIINLLKRQKSLTTFAEIVKSTI